MKQILLITLSLCLPFCFSNCATLPTNTKAIVDVSQQKMVVSSGIKTKEFTVSTARKGVGGKLGSEKTPIGTFEIVRKEPHHRYGKVLRLGGWSVDGYDQGPRGILFHDASTVGVPGSRGCIRVHYTDIDEVYDSFDVGDTVYIRI